MSGQKPLCESVVLDCGRKASHFCSKILALFMLTFVAKSYAYDRQWWKAVVAAGRIHRGQLRRKQKLQTTVFTAAPRQPEHPPFLKTKPIQASESRHRFAVLGFGLVSRITDFNGSSVSRQ
jgi:hypothetical protein